MADSALCGIRDYRKLSERIGTAGQPTGDELAAVARAGYDTVINLGMGNEAHAPTDEGCQVCSLGMEYVHIPVVWERPTRADLDRFVREMEARREQRLFIHCAANRRVSVFIALYRILRMGWTRELALQQSFLDSMPQVWHAFVDQVLDH